MTASHASLSSHTYRPDIDGLRAIAVLSVVAYHAFPTVVRGGFIGVDVFFVISGYLISAIVFESLARGTFSFGAFYARRIRRIFPALLLVLAAVFALGWFVLLADEFKQLGRHLAGSGVFVSNFVLWNESGYFDRAAETKPLLHLWSLAIEEQFYLTWPLLLWLSARWRVGPVLLIAGAGAASFGLSVHTVATDATAAFYSPLTRCWELLAGSLFAWLTRFGARPGATPSNVLSAVGACLLTYGALRISRDAAFPGAWAAIPVIGAVCLIAAGNEAWFNRVVLSADVLVWVGLISFPLYLWHWPLLSFLTIVEGTVPTGGARLAAVLASFALAWLTYAGIERPIRFGARDGAPVAALCAGMLTIGMVGYFTFLNGGLPFRVRKFEVLSQAADEWQYPGRLTPFMFEGRRLLRQDSGTPHLTLFIGDSNVEQYYVRTDELIATDPAHTHGVVFSTSGGCLPVPALLHDEVHRGCEGLMENGLQFARSEPRLRTVVIAAHWNQYLSKGFGLRGTFSRGSRDYTAALHGLAESIGTLRRAGMHVYVVLNIPTGAELDPRFMARRSLATFPRVLSIRPGGLERASLEAAFGGIQADLTRTAEAAGARVIDPFDYVCDALRCPGVDETGTPIYKDGAHLRPTYVRKHAVFIDETVNARAN